MNKEQSWSAPKIIYAILMSFLLLGYMIIIATYKDTTLTGQVYNLPIQFWILRVITSVLAIYLGKLWKDKGFLILMAYLLLKAIRVAADNPAYLFEQGVSESLLTGLWVFSACYGLARIIEKDQLKKYLSINAAIWTAGMVIYSCLGIYAAWTGKNIYTIGEGSYWGIYDNRLFLSYYVTTSGSVLSISGVIAFTGVFIYKNTHCKVLFLLSFICIIIALSLTDARGAQVSLSAGVAITIGIAFFSWLISIRNCKKSWAAWTMAIISVGVAFVLCIILCSRIIYYFNKIKTTGLLIRTAYAEQIEEAQLSNRGFFGYNTFSSRNIIWDHVINKIKDNPILLYKGTSIRDPMSYVNPIWWITASHTHCMPLMILFENGIPGCLLICGFLGIICFRSIRLIVDKEYKWELYLIPVIISVSVGELVECFTWLRSGQCPTLPFFFIAMGVIMTTGQNNKTEK